MRYRVIFKRSTPPREEAPMRHGIAPCIDMPGRTGTLYDTPTEAAKALQTFLNRSPNTEKKFVRIEPFRGPTREEREERIEELRQEVRDFLLDAEQAASSLASTLRDLRGSGGDASAAARIYDLVDEAYTELGSIT